MAHSECLPVFPVLPYPEWQRAYRAALFELNPQRLPRRISAARKAIYERRLQLTSGEADLLEKRALEKALSALSALLGEY